MEIYLFLAAALCARAAKDPLPVLPALAPALWIRPAALAVILFAMLSPPSNSDTRDLVVVRSLGLILDRARLGWALSNSLSGGKEPHPKCTKCPTFI